MAGTIKIKRSAVPAKVPTTTDLELGELAVNTYDGKLYTKKNDGTDSVVQIGAGGGGGASYEVGQVIYTDGVPTQSGQWVKAGGYYSKATYPDLATKLGDIQDLGDPDPISQGQLPQTYTYTGLGQAVAATDGTVYVLIGNAGQLRVSTDQVNWLAVPSQSTQNFNEVQYLNGIFFALGNNGVLCTSTDGYSWTSIAGINAGYTLNSIAYGAGIYVIATSAGYVYTSTDAVSWTEKLAIPVNNNDIIPLVSRATYVGLLKVIYANSLFVVVGNSNQILTSPNGLTWTLRNWQSIVSTVTPYVFYDIKYEGGKYIAVGDYATATSTDGVAWQSKYGTMTGGYVQSTPSINSSRWATNGTITVAISTKNAIVRTTDGVNWMGSYTPYFNSNSSGTFTEINYLNGLFVVVTSNGAILTSPDGVIFSFAAYGNQASTYEAYYSVAYGNSTYVAVGIENSSLPLQATSSDGINWVQTTASGAPFNKVAFGAGLFVAGANTTAGIMSSPDGVNWTTRQATTGTVRDVQFINSNFVAVTSDGKIYYSANGTAWTLATTVGLNSISSVTYSNGIYMVVTIGNQVSTSPDLVNWTNRIIPTVGTPAAPSWSYGAWDGSQWLIVGTMNSNTTPGLFATSPDLVTWTLKQDASFSPLNGFAVINNKGVAFGNNGIYVITRATREKVCNGGVWAFAPFASATAPTAKTIAYNGSNQWVSVGGNNQILYSSDGETWNAANPSTTSANFIAVQYLNGAYIAVGAPIGSSTAFVLTSTDGINWTSRTLTGAQNFQAIAFGASTWVIVGTSNSIFYSTNLTTWTATSAGAGSFADVTFGGTNFVAVNSTGGICYSANGSVWTVATGTGTTQFTKLIYTGTQFVAINQTGTIYTSPTGVTWTQRFSAAVTTTYDMATSDGNKIVATGATGIVCMSIDAGVNWFKVNTPATVNASVVWTGTYWISGQCMSLDGYRWEAMFPGALNITISTKYALYAGGKVVCASTGCMKSLATGSSKFWDIASEAINTPLLGGVARNVAYGAGVYVVPNTTSANKVANLMVSTDGLLWKTVNNAQNNITNSVIWNGTEFVAVGNNGTYYVSADGITWTSYFDESASTFYALAVLNGKTVAIGQQATVILRGAARQAVLVSAALPTTYSTSSVTYTQASASSGVSYVVSAGNSIPGVFRATTIGTFAGVRLKGAIYDNPTGTTTINIYYVNGVYFAFSNSTINISTDDGVTWTGFQIAGFASAVVYGAGTYVITCSLGVMVSTNLNSWALNPDASSTLLNGATSVVFGAGLFVACGSTTVYSSADGIVWTTRTPVGGTKVIYENSMFVVVGASNIIWSSINGVKWKRNQGVTGGTFIDVAWNGSTFCAISSVQGYVMIGNGTSWEARQPAGAVTWATVSSGGANTFLIQASGSSQGVNFITTDNGETWNNVADQFTNNTTTGRYSCQFLNGNYIAVQPQAVQYSTDGINWVVTNVVLDFVATVTKMYKLNGYYFSCVSNGIWSTSSISAGWIAPSRNLPRNNAPSAMAYGNGVYLAAYSSSLSQPAAIYSSSDAVTWVKVNEGLGAYIPTFAGAIGVNDMVFAGGKFIISSNSSTNNIYTSTDGVTWAKKATPYVNSIIASGMASDGTTVVLNTSLGMLKSVDAGSTWEPLMYSGNTNFTPMYDNGVWTFGGMVSTDLVSFYDISYGSTTAVPVAIYSPDGTYAIGIIGTLKVLITPSTQGITLAPATKTAITTYTAVSKPFVTDGAKLYAIVSNTTQSVNPFNWMEFPLWSYNTSTTFYVPPVTSGIKANAYVYAGA